MRVDAGDTVQDLARPRVRLRAAHRPAALGAIDPLDARVPGIEKRGPRRQVLDHERILEAGGLEGVVPPESALADRRALGLRDAAVEVIDDRLDRLRERGARVLLDEPPAHREVFFDRLGEGRRVIEVAPRDEADARIERARRKTRLRQLQERVMPPQAHRVAVGQDHRHAARRVFGGEGQRRLDLGVLRKSSGPLEIQGRSRRRPASSRPCGPASRPARCPCH